MKNTTVHRGTYFLFLTLGTVFFLQAAFAQPFGLSIDAISEDEEDRYAQLQIENTTVIERAHALETQSWEAEAAGDAQRFQKLKTESDEILKRREDQYLKEIERKPFDYITKVALGDFYLYTHRENLAYPYWKSAADHQPSNHWAWNNLGNYYGHFGPADDAFPAFEKALSLKPLDATYLYNYGTTLFAFRLEAMSRYGLKDEQGKWDEQKLFDMALRTLDKAAMIDSENLELQKEIAIDYYNIKPARTSAALKAWRRVLKLAEKIQDLREISQTQLHIARTFMIAGCYPKAKETLEFVVHPFDQKPRDKMLKEIHNHSDRLNCETTIAQLRKN